MIFIRHEKSWIQHEHVKGYSIIPNIIEAFDLHYRVKVTGQHLLFVLIKIELTSQYRFVGSDTNMAT